ncbi:MAG: pyruvate, phosphate dikinase, partial [Roseobacter sp.]
MLRLKPIGAAVQNNPNTTLVTATAPIQNQTHGGRAKCLQRLVRLDLPVPRTVALSFDAVERVAKGDMPDVAAVVGEMPQGALMGVRPSSQDPDWGGPGAVLNIGINNARFDELCESIGEPAAAALYTRFVQTYAINVARLDPDMFDEVEGDDRSQLAQSLHAYQAETEEEFPQDPAVQLTAVLRSMARAWDGTSARLLRQAKGAPADAGLGLVVQRMALGVGRADEGECGSGVIQFIDPATGLPQITGRYLSQSQGREALISDARALFLTRDDRGPSLEDLCPEVFATLTEFGALWRQRLREEMQVEFTIDAGTLCILDAV